MIKSPGSPEEEVPMILPNGEFNPKWRTWYGNQYGLKPKEVSYHQVERVKKMPEPDLVTKSGKLNPVWITWYRIINRVTTPTARNAGKAILALRAKQTKEETA
ncbi:hypothetical protein [Pseudomonas aeruginosa]|uniref:hypothetical protein n=1 Tax=Pseudomonas aeruginosa TaxID=287 RepID=UPI001BD6CB4D|nr:hypothetical protein [Pseudomonas aeruginosa]MBS9730297.1 hypothetical protein [Pseudomonas aeruginosa]